MVSYSACELQQLASSNESAIPIPLPCCFNSLKQQLWQLLRTYTHHHQPIFVRICIVCSVYIYRQIYIYVYIYYMKFIYKFVYLRCLCLCIWDCVDDFRSTVASARAHRLYYTNLQNKADFFLGRVLGYLRVFGCTQCKCIMAVRVCSQSTP